jgi:hypothetical protein
MKGFTFMEAMLWNIAVWLFIIVAVWYFFL